MEDLLSVEYEYLIEILGEYSAVSSSSEVASPSPVLILTDPCLMEI